MANATAAPSRYVDRDKLFKLRQERGWSMDAVARRSGVSKATVYNIESGRSDGSPLVRDALARAFRIDPAELEG